MVTLYYNRDYKYTTLEAALFASFHRLGWSVSNGWLVLACVTGYGGVLSKFLSNRVWVPIARLTYCAYLTNGLVELYLLSISRTQQYMSVATAVSIISLFRVL